MARQSFRKLLLALLFGVFNVASMLGANVFWDNAVSGDWDDATKWTGGVVPQAGDDVFINVAGTYTVTLDDANREVNSLTVGGASGTQTLSIVSRTLTLNAASEIGANGILQLRNSTITGTGTLDLKGRTRILQTCTIGLDATNFVGADIKVEGSLNGDANLRVDGEFNNRGSILLINSHPSIGRAARLTVRNGESLENATGATISIAQGTVIGTRQLTIENNATFRNFGTVNVAQFLTCEPADNSIFENRGTVNVTGASLVCNQNATSEIINRGTCNIGAGFRLQITGGRLEQQGGTYGGDGLLTLISLTINGNSSFEPDTDCSLRSCTVNVAAEVTQLMNVINTNNFHQPLQVATAATLQILGGLSGGAELRLHNRCDNFGTLKLSNEHPTIARTAGVRLNNASAFFNNATGANIQILSGTTGGSRNIITNTGSRFENHATINANIFYLIDNNGTGEFVNAGTIDATLANVSVQNDAGADFVNRGTLNVTPAGQFFASNGQFIQENGVFTGTGLLIFEFMTFNGSSELVNNQDIRVRSSTFNIDFNNRGLALLRGTTIFNGLFLNDNNARALIQASTTGDSDLRIEDRGINRGQLIAENNHPTLARTARLRLQSGHRFTNATNATLAFQIGTNGGNRELIVQNNAQFRNFGNIINNQNYTIDLASGEFQNHANLTLTSATVTIVQAGTSEFTNAGVIAVATGLTLTVNNGSLGSSGGRIEGGGLLSLSFADLEGDKFITNIRTNLRSSDINVDYENRLTTNLHGTNEFNKELINGTGATLNLEGNLLAGLSTLRINRRLTNFGLIRFTNSHPTLARNATLLMNASSDALINSSGASIVFLNGSQGGAREITLSPGTLLRNFGSFTSDVFAGINNNGGIFDNRGQIILTSANFTVDQPVVGARTINSGQITISPGQRFNCDDQIFEHAGGLVQGGGEFHMLFGTLQGAGTFTIETPTVLRSADSELPIKNTSTLHVRGTVNLQENFENATAATVKVEANDIPGTSRMVVHATLTNFGLLDLFNSHTIARESSIDIKDELRSMTNATIQFRRGQSGGARKVAVDAAAEFLNFGDIKAATAGTIENSDGLFINHGQLEVTGASLSIDQSATGEYRFGGQADIHTGNSLTVNDGILELNNQQVTGGGLLNLHDLDLEGIGAFDVVTHTRIRDCDVNVAINNSAQLELRGDTFLGLFVENATDATIAVESTTEDLTAKIRIEAGMLNRGQLIMDNLNAGVFFTTEIIVEDGETFENATGSSLDILSTFGLLRQIDLSQSGSLHVFGDLFVATGAQLSVFGGGQVNTLIGTTASAGPPATISGHGTLDLDLGGTQFFGAVTPGNSPGALDWAGDFTLRNQRSVFEVEIGGSTPGVDHDQFNISGVARFDNLGILDIRLINDFVPQVGEEFVIMTYSQAVGRFAEIRGLDLGNGDILTADYRSDKLVLFVATETFIDVDIYMYGLWNGTSHKRSAAIVELREGADLASSVLTSRTSGLIGTDARVRGGFEDIQTGDYWVIVRHGGNFSVASATRISINQGEINLVDFTDAANVVNGDTGMTTILLNGTNYDVVRTGDFNSDLSVSADDFIQFFIPNFGTVNPGQVPPLD